MKYMGSKARYAKYILPIILKDRKPDQYYIEPFVGGANVIDKVNGKRIGNDTNRYLIALLESLQNGWTPPITLTEDQYKSLRNNQDQYPPELVGYAGIPCSYGAKWFGGYCRGNKDNGEPRDYIKEAYNNCIKQSPRLIGIEFCCKDYLLLEIPPNSIIYCDPPYANTTKYKDDFDHEQFWQWCDGLVRQGHQVFVSEYTAPEGWRCVWEKRVNSSLTKDTGAKKATEKLFTKGGDHE